MTERPTLCPVDTSVPVGRSEERDRPQQNLRMIWAIDPATGKLAVRWAVKRAETADIVPLVPAA